MIRDGSWRVAEIGRGKMEARLFWHILLFVLYLLTIGLLFVGVVLERALDHHSLWRVWIERAYLFFGVSSFLFTFGLPGALLKMQYDRYDAEIARRRRDAHIQDDDVPNNPNG